MLRVGSPTRNDFQTCGFYFTVCRTRSHFDQASAQSSILDQCACTMRMSSVRGYFPSERWTRGMRLNNFLLALSILSVLVEPAVAQTGSSDARSAAGDTGTTSGGPTGGIPGGPGSPTSPNTLGSTGTSNGGGATQDSSEAARPQNVRPPDPQVGGDADRGPTTATPHRSSGDAR
jgi:hypothetical protein